jgi:hypothetical protein
MGARAGRRVLFPDRESWGSTRAGGEKQKNGSDVRGGAAAVASEGNWEAAARREKVS